MREKSPRKEWDLKEDFLLPLLSPKENGELLHHRIKTLENLLVGDKVLVCMGVTVGKIKTWGKFNLKVIKVEGAKIELKGSHFIDGFGTYHTTIQDPKNSDLARKIHFTLDRFSEYQNIIFVVEKNDENQE